MEKDCEPTRQRVRLPVLLDYLVGRLSWSLTAVFFLLFGVFQREFDVSLFFSALYVISVFVHLLREIAEVCNAYPLWLEIGRHVKTHRNASLPLWVSDAIFAGVLIYQGRVALALTAFFLFIAFDWIFALCTQGSEEFFRSLIHFPVVENVPSPPVEGQDNVVEDHDFADFRDLTENDLLLMQTTRSRNGNNETIQGEALIEFEHESKLAFLNIPFCPPFIGVPQLDFEQISGENVSINVSLLQAFGARLEIKRSISASAFSEGEKEPVRIAFYSVFPPLKEERCS